MCNCGPELSHRVRGGSKGCGVLIGKSITRCERTKCVSCCYLKNIAKLHEPFGIQILGAVPYVHVAVEWYSDNRFRLLWKFELLFGFKKNGLGSAFKY